MKRTFKTLILSVTLMVVAFFAFIVVGARFDASKDVVAVEATSEPSAAQPEVIVAAPAAVEDEFSEEAVASEEAESAVADETAVESVELAMPKFVGEMKLNIPVNGIALYREDPDDTLSTIRWEQVYEQYAVNQYAAKGFVTGNKAGQHFLATDWVSHQVAAFSYETINAERVPEEARTLSGNDFANYFIGKVTRLSDNGKAVTLNCEEYDEEVHHAVVNIFVGEEAEEFWTVFVRDDNTWTLCLEGKKAPTYYGPSQPAPQSEEPQQEEPAEDIDPAPVWDDPTDPDPVPTQPEQDWDPEFNFDVDPSPVWEDPSDPTPVQPSEPQDWDSDFNFEGNTDPAPIWDEPTNVDPAPVWEPVSEPSSDPVPAVSTDWDSAFNFSDSTPVAHNVDPAPVWEAVSAPVSDPVPATSSGWDTGFNFESSASVSVVSVAPAAPVVVESAPAVSAAPAADNNPAPIWDNPVNESSSSAAADDGWDAGFNF